MKKRLKEVQNVKPGDTLKVNGYIYEVDVVIINHGPQTVVLEMWLWARPTKRITLTFNDSTFPVTVR